MSYIQDTHEINTIFGTYRVQIIADDDPMNPREEWDNFGKMICFHSRYNLGDYKEAKQYRDADDFLSTLADIDYDELYNKYYDKLPDTLSYKERWKLADEYMNDKISKVINANYIILPLYLYDHSGLAMSTGGFSCPWDSGQVGWIYASHEDIKKEYGWKNLTKDRINKVESLLRSEVETYDMYLRGDVYGFKLFAPPNKKAMNEDGLTEDDIDDKNISDYCEELDSCWGFFGYGWEKNGIKSEVNVDYHVRKNIKNHIAKVKAWIKSKTPLMYRQPLVAY